MNEYGPKITRRQLQRAVDDNFLDELKQDLKVHADHEAISLEDVVTITKDLPQWSKWLHKVRVSAWVFALSPWCNPPSSSGI